MPIKETLCHLILLLLRAASVSASWIITDQSVRRWSFSGRTRRPNKYAHPPDTTTTTQPTTVSSSSSSSSSPLFWKERIRGLQKTVEEQNKMYKIQTHQTRLKDRATYLATRALYMQTQFVTQSFNQTREMMMTRMEPQQQQQQLLLQREPYWPAPTLSYSATRNYKRKQDVIVALQQQQQQQGGVLVEKEDPRNNKQNYKKGEQGKQFQHACHVYIRLLEALDDIRNQATIQGTLFVRQLERQKATSSQTTTTSNLEMNLNTTETLLLIHQRHFHRMKLLIQLALHANHASFFFQEQQEQKLVNATALESIDTQDLLQAIYIRGNLPKNKWKRLPKKRSKVLEYFQQSYSYPLFHV